ncbi:MAG TPA: NAD(P)H-hydrate dehydratase [Acidobacteriaceae bacterium]
MKILTAKEMGATDRRTAEEFGVPLGTLMENAGSAVAGFCLRQAPTMARVVVLCGKGNNGGDGLVAARVLAGAGVDVAVALLGRTDELKGEAAEALRRLREEAAEVVVREVVDEGRLAGVSGLVQSADVVIDAVVGTGFKPPLRGLAMVARQMVATSDAMVVAVDLPSGWDADSMEQSAEGACRADAVVTFTAPKRAHVFGNLTGRVFGPVVVVEIGSPAEAVVSDDGLSWAGSAKAIAERPRDVNSNKGKYGHVLVVGGSYGTAGAPAMASLAALRTGAGLVSAAVPECVANAVARVAPELMMRPLGQVAATPGQERYGVPSELNLEPERLAELLKGIKVVAIGPGLSTKMGAAEFAREFVAKVTLPMVVDADALNAFEGRAELLNGEGRVMVLTPHPGEMARLAGMTVKEVEADRVGLARRFAMEHKLTLVLKGWRTLVAHPDGRVAVNTTGNPAMAKGGSGDILTGMVAAMLAQFPDDVARAVEAAVVLHGLAGDFAVRAMEEHTVLATDTVTHLSDAFRYRVKDAGGMTWICGLHD